MSGNLARSSTAAASFASGAVNGTALLKQVQPGTSQREPARARQGSYLVELQCGLLCYCNTGFVNGERVALAYIN